MQNQSKREFISKAAEQQRVYRQPSVCCQAAHPRTGRSKRESVKKNGTLAPSAVATAVAVAIQLAWSAKGE